MYGTIARLHPTAGRAEELASFARRVASRSVPGYRASYLFRPDHEAYDRPTAFLVAVFDDEAAYRANADSPDQHAEYLELRALLDDDPDWMDGTFEGV